MMMRAPRFEGVWLGPAKRDIETAWHNLGFIEKALQIPSAFSVELLRSQVAPVV